MTATDIKNKLSDIYPMFRIKVSNYTSNRHNKIDMVCKTCKFSRSTSYYELLRPKSYRGCSSCDKVELDRLRTLAEERMSGIIPSPATLVRETPKCASQVIFKVK